MYGEERWHYREIVNDDRQTHAVYLYAAMAKAKELGVKICIGDNVFRLNELQWATVVKVYMIDPTPFKELFSLPESEVIKYLKECNDAWMRQTGRFRE